MTRGRCEEAWQRCPCSASNLRANAISIFLCLISYQGEIVRLSEGIDWVVAGSRVSCPVLSDFEHFDSPFNVAQVDDTGRPDRASWSVLPYHSCQPECHPNKRSARSFLKHSATPTRTPSPNHPIHMSSTHPSSPIPPTPINPQKQPATSNNRTTHHSQHALRLPPRLHQRPSLSIPRGSNNIIAHAHAQQQQTEHPEEDA